jgi:hypothetical protein
MDPLDEYEKTTKAAKNIFTNSLEQFVMSIESQLIFVTIRAKLYFKYYSDT